MSERRTLSLGNVNTQSRAVADPTRAWNVSEKRAAALRDRARDQRRNPTEAQKALWARIGDKQLGFTFNREVVMGSAIVDFACKPRWLVVEVGGTGDDADATLAALSDRKLADVGVRVLRFGDDEVLESTDAVCATIAEELAKPFDKNAARRSATPRGPATASPDAGSDADALETKDDDAAY